MNKGQGRQGGEEEPDVEVIERLSHNWESLPLKLSFATIISLSTAYIASHR